MATNQHNSTRPGAGRLCLYGVLAALMGLATAGCLGRGLLYTRVVRPYSHDFQDTPAGTKTCRVNEHILREPVTRASVSVNFTTRIAEEAARTAGMTNLYYADVETLSILAGLYEKKTLILCGE